VTTTDLLSRSELFSDLSKETLAEIAILCREITLAKGDFVFRIGDPSKELFILAEGCVDLGFAAVAADEPMGGAIRESGDVFGWGALVGEANYRLINAICVRQTRLITVDGLALMNLLEGSPGGFTFLRKLLGIVLNRIVSLAAV
jgi:putative ABC transport system ATP-binding protein